ncbi:Hypothetical predicted protein [Paramuricea clavata]|uniref:Uncharacterized protein n=1 Tax=Paramuricea clavata TaxID=317549 RepID=A0A7D9DXX5_PARCT|nr:Hypothetical predicted protein [Paramuricea clavata]
MSVNHRLNPNYRKATASNIGKRNRHVITLNKTRAKPGEDLIIEIPRLKVGANLVPESVFVQFDMTVSGTTTQFQNNLSRLLVTKLEIKVSGKRVYDNTREDLYGVYQNLWLSKNDRDDMTKQGITSKNLRGLMSGSDDANGTTDGDKELYAIHGNRVKIPVCKILERHGLFAPYPVRNNFIYTITLPESSQGKSLVYSHIQHLRTDDWKKESKGHHTDQLNHQHPT